jgi:hypothetical protein
VFPCCGRGIKVLFHPVYAFYSFIPALQSTSISEEPVRRNRSTANYSSVLRTYFTVSSHPSFNPPCQYNIPFVGAAAPPVLLGFGDAAAALEDRARMELTADAAAEEAADAASEVASGRSGIMDMEPPISEMPWSWARARGARSARRRMRGGSILMDGWYGRGDGWFGRCGCVRLW